MKLIKLWFFFLAMPNLGELIYPLPVQTRQEIRKLEKVFLKLQKTELNCAFNETCLKENKLPKYNHIYSERDCRTRYRDISKIYREKHRQPARSDFARIRKRQYDLPRITPQEHTKIALPLPSCSKRQSYLRQYK